MIKLVSVVLIAALLLVFLAGCKDEQPTTAGQEGQTPQGPATEESEHPTSEESPTEGQEHPTSEHPE